MEFQWKNGSLSCLARNGYTLQSQITRIVTNGPAEKAGFLVGDLIFSLDGEMFQNEHFLENFRGEIGAKNPLDEVVLGVRRVDGKTEDLRVVLAKHPGEMLNIFPQDHKLLDERAREQHFEIWLDELAKKVK